MAINLNILMAAAVFLAAAVEAQQPPSCASKLIPCASYLNSTKPPESCCGPLKDAVKNELPCLCSIFNSPDLLKAFNINVTQALELPMHCGVKTDQKNLCSKSAATPPSSSKTPPAAGGGSSGTGGSGSSGAGGNGGSGSSPAKNNASRAFGGLTTCIGMPSFVAFFLFTWSAMAL